MVAFASQLPVVYNEYRLFDDNLRQQGRVQDIMRCMMRKIVSVAVVCLVLLAACVATPTPATFPPSPSITSRSPTLVPTITAESAKPSATIAPTAVPTVAPTTTPTISAIPVSMLVDVSAQEYIDDRSNAVSLLASLWNAINRHEYLRAYSYWEADSLDRAKTLEKFQNGYSNTVSVQFAVGPVTEGAAAGNLFSTASVILTALNNDGSTQQYVACYQTHLANPGIQGTLPFQSLGIQQGAGRLVPPGVDPLTRVSSICSSVGIPTGESLSSLPPSDTTDISTARYLDDRSDAVQVLRSFFNAINRTEYLRAYSYWEPMSASTLLPSLEQFALGYSDTLSVQLITGQVLSDSGAGQYYYQVPVTIKATTRSSQTQTFVGCYVLHISNPGIQGVEPFQALGIKSAQVSQVDNTANTANLMAAACD